MDKATTKLRKLAIYAIEQDKPLEVVRGLVNQVNLLQDQYSADHPAY